MSSTKRTIEEQIAELQKKQKELKEQEKRLRARKSKEERAKRTKHLIEMGGTIYSILGREFVEGDIERLAYPRKRIRRRRYRKTGSVSERTGQQRRILLESNE